MSVQTAKCEVRVGVIKVSKFFEDAKSNGRYIANKGDSTCVIAADEQQLPYEDDCMALWVSASVCHPVSVIDSKDLTLQLIEVQDFLKIPDHVQLVLVSGILEGMAFMPRNYSVPGYEKWIDCVRTKTLGDTLEELLTFLEENPQEQKFRLPWAISRVIDQRNYAR